MNLVLSEEQRMIRDAAADFLARASDSTALRAALESGADPAVWSTLAGELGWCAVPVAERHGGLGLGPVELSLIQEQAGRRLLVSPFLATVALGATILECVAEAKVQAEWLPRIAAGERTLAVPLTPSASGWRDAGLQALEGPAGWTLSGRIEAVLDGTRADAWLLPAQTGEGSGWFLLSPDGAGSECRAVEGWDLSRPLAEIRLDGAGARRIDDRDAGAPPWDQALARARLYLAAEQLGGAQQCLDLTVAYLSERKQFGRTIASFQAVKHRCAEMMVAVEATRSAVYGAAFVAANDSQEAALDCAAARALADETFRHCAAEAIQLHGGVGFTWEYDPQLYFKRAWASRHALGESAALRALIADALLARTSHE